MKDNTTELTELLEQSEIALASKFGNSSIRACLSRLVTVVKDDMGWKKAALKYHPWRGEEIPDPDSWYHSAVMSDLDGYSRGLDNGWQSGFLYATTETALEVRRDTKAYKEAYRLLDQIRKLVEDSALTSNENGGTISKGDVRG